MCSKNYNLIYSAAIFITILFGCAFTACSSDEPEKITNISEKDVPGLWYGRHVYPRGNGSYGEQFLTVWFYEDHTGKLEYESPTSIAAGVFTWEFSKNTIRCIGGHASSANDSGEIIDICFRVEGNRLYPEGKYENFILTTDGSVEIYEGKEVCNQSELLQQEWISSDGLTIIWPYSNNEFYYYELSSPFGKFKTFEKGNYNYSYRESTLQLLFVKDGEIYREKNYSIEKISNKELILSISNSEKTFKPYEVVPEEDKDGSNNENNSDTKFNLSSLMGIKAQAYYDKTLKDVVANLKFNEKGQVVQYEDNHDYTITFTYGVNEIVRTETKKSGDSWQYDTYKLTNGLVTQIKRNEKQSGIIRDTETTISYNGNKVVLIQESFNGKSGEHSLNWNSNGDISEITLKQSDSRLISKYTFTYSSSETFMPQFSPFGCQADYYTAWMDPFLWVEGYFGDIPKHIMKSKYVTVAYDGINFNGRRQITINTTLDNKSRISRQVINDKNLESNDTESNIIQFDWK